MQQNLEITMIGAGYVGLTSAVAFALAGHQVHLFEHNPERRKALQQKHIPFSEPDLETVFENQSNISISQDLGQSIADSSLIFIAVGTPPTPAHGVDLTQVFAAVKQIAVHLDKTPRVIVLKSTVPVGTNQEVDQILKKLAPDAIFFVANNPEFLRQGRALRDAIFPDRIVLGTNQNWALEQLLTVYAPIINSSFAVPRELEVFRPKQVIPVLKISPASAELAKYAANAFLAMKISFINEIANVCDTTVADVSHTSLANIDEIIAVLEQDTRIGKDFLQPGLGYGGSCFPKDTRALNQLANRSGYEFRLLRAVIEVNNQQRFRVLEKLEKALGGFRDKRIAILGLSFKPNTDDLRESIGLEMAQELMARGAEITAHDPMLKQMPALEIITQTNLEDCLHNADAAILVTEWDVYKNANWLELGKTMKQRIMLDGRNVLQSKTMRLAGFTYHSVGRNSQ